MRLLVLGVSHHTAPIDLRERLAFAAGDLGDAVSTLARDPALGEVVLLSTCNRTELYATCHSLEDGHEAMAGFLATARAVPADDLRAHIYTRSEADAARHLFRVAAGLDSLVVGEPQILGQVKQAYASATDLHATGALLNRLFHTAFTAGKRVRSETELAEGAVSVSYAALGLARKIVGDLRHASVLVVGAGEMAELTARHFAAQQPKRITVCSRTAAHAEALAARHRRDDRAVERARRRARPGRRGRHRDRRDDADPDRGRASRRPCGTAAGVRCSSSTSPCRATSIRSSPATTTSSSTTSTTCSR